MGAGGGGFMAFFAPPECHDRIREKLHSLICVPFQFEFAGSQIVLHDYEENYDMAEALRAHQHIAPFREARAEQGRGARPES